MDHRQAGIMGPGERAPSRRDFLKAAGIGVAGTVVAGTVVGGLGRGVRPASADTTSVKLIATDGTSRCRGVRVTRCTSSGSAT